MKILKIRNTFAHGSLVKNKYLYQIAGTKNKTGKKMFIGEKKAFEQFIWDVVDVDIELAKVFNDEFDRFGKRLKKLKKKKIPDYFNNYRKIKNPRKTNSRINFNPTKT